jgi:hypothetical protein
MLPYITACRSLISSALIHSVDDFVRAPTELGRIERKFSNGVIAKRFGVGAGQLYWLLG